MIKIKVMALIALLMLFGGMFGYIIGYNQGIRDCVEIGYSLLESGNVKVNINPELVTYALTIYQAKAKDIIERFNKTQ